MENVTSKTFYRFRYVSDPRLSPDAKIIAFMVKRVNPGKNGYDSDIYLHTGGVSRRLTQRGDVNSFLWQNNDTILFSSARDPRDQKRVKEGEPLTVFYRITLSTGEVERAFELPLQSAQLTLVKEDLFLVHGRYDNNVLRPGEERGAVTTLSENPYWGEFGLG